MNCIFCEAHENDFLDNDEYRARWDAHPVSKGHCLIIPKEHVVSFFELNSIGGLFEMIKKAKAVVDEKYSPDGYNIGINDGRAAGRTVDHLHVHLIPRYEGDVKEPRGGVRHVIPGKGFY